jgi:hypothetical protein
MPKQPLNRLWDRIVQGHGLGKKYVSEFETRTTQIFLGRCWLLTSRHPRP